MGVAARRRAVATFDYDVLAAAPSGHGSSTPRWAVPPRPRVVGSDAVARRGAG